MIALIVPDLVASDIHGRTTRCPGDRDKKGRGTDRQRVGTIMRDL